MNGVVIVLYFCAVIVIAVDAVAYTVALDVVGPNFVVTTAVVFVAVVVAAIVDVAVVVAVIVDVVLYATMLVDSFVFSISLINFRTTLQAYVVKLKEWKNYCLRQ